MKKVVIVGGGVAGKVLASDLVKNKNIETVLVEPKDYIEVPFARLRALVEPDDFSPTIRRNFSELIPEVKHIKMRATGIKEKKLFLEDGSDVDFDYLVIATGAKFLSWPFLNSPEKDIESRQKAVAKEADKITKANSILIIGGGSVGVELAGEIAYRWKDKDITLIEGSSRILGGLSEKMTKRATKILKSMNVKITTNKKLSEDKDGKLIDADGSVYEADLVFKAVGISIESDWIDDDSGISKTERGAIKVDGSLRAIGRDDVFAIGDITDVPEIKLGAFAVKHSDITAKNLNSLISNPDAKLKTYKPGKDISMVPIGKKLGAVQIPFGHPHFLIFIKQKDLFMSKVF
ncbi:MAG: NAD(P)/FAD-dependent oxidoreductase [Sphaerochaeta sp.]